MELSISNLKVNTTYSYTVTFNDNVNTTAVKFVNTDVHPTKCTLDEIKNYLLEKSYFRDLTNKHLTINNQDGDEILDIENCSDRLTEKFQELGETDLINSIVENVLSAPVVSVKDIQNKIMFNSNRAMEMSFVKYSNASEEEKEEAERRQDKYEKTVKHLKGLLNEMC